VREDGWQLEKKETKKGERICAHGDTVRKMKMRLQMLLEQLQLTPIPHFAVATPYAAPTGDGLRLMAR
jgi:hypothetical protein